MHIRICIVSMRTIAVVASALVCLIMAGTACGKQGKGSEPSAPARAQAPAPVVISPGAPDAAQQLAAALQTRDAVIKLEPGIFEGALDISVPVTITGVPEDPGKVTIRVQAPGSAAIRATGKGLLKVTGITIAAATGAVNTTGISAGGETRMEITACRFEGPLAGGISLTGGDTIVKQCVFMKIQGDAITVTGGRATVTDTEFANIQGAAVKAADAVITVDHAKVTYTEKGGITATGGEVTVTVSTFENCAPSAIDIRKAAKAAITDCTVKNATEYCIIIHDAAGAIVKNNQCDDPGVAGIWLQGPGRVDQNTIRAADKGIGVRVNGAGGVISGNKVDHLKTGIEAAVTEGILLENNAMRWCGTGILVKDSTVPVIRTNNGQACTGSCIAVIGSKTCRVEENQLSGSARGVWVQACDAAVLRNTVKDCSEAAIKADKRCTVEIGFNTISGSNAEGICIHDCTPSIHDNTITGLTVHANDSSDVRAYNNAITGDNCMYPALMFVGATGGAVHGNRIGVGLRAGISLDGSSDIDVYANEISGRKAIGLSVLGGWNIKLHANLVHDNVEAGIMVDGTKTAASYANTLHHNGIGLRYNESSGEVYDNLVHDNSEGLVFWENADVHAHHNLCHSNISGILYRGSWGEADHNLLYDNEWGFFLKSTRGKKVIVHDNEIRNNTRDGIRAEWTADCEIFQNRIYDNDQCGIRVKPKCPMNIHENYIAGNGLWGIRAWEENDIKLVRNIIARNNAGGIAAGANTGFLAERNTIVGNMGGGVLAYGGGAITLQRNIIYENGSADLNTRPPGGEGSEITGAGTIMIKGNIIFSRAGGDVTQGITDGGGNIVRDPMLDNPGGTGFVPQDGSPALTPDGTIGAMDAGGQTTIPLAEIPGTGPRQEIKAGPDELPAAEPVPAQGGNEPIF
ncbi:MAG: right-handed parallel beta-helix repeat-containing protein [Planctomycetota bacterium]